MSLPHYSTSSLQISDLFHAQCVTHPIDLYTIIMGADESVPDSGDDELCAAILGGKKQPENPNPRRNSLKKRSEKYASVRKWENARDRLKEKANNDQYDIEARKHPIFKVPFDKIEYADEPLEADRLADLIIRAVSSVKGNLAHLGFDVEGDYDTLQLFTIIKVREYPFVFQLGLLTQNNQLPEKLFSLSTSNTFVGTSDPAAQRPSSPVATHPTDL